MATIQNFSTKNSSATKNRYDIYNPEFENPIFKTENDFLSANIHKWTELISFLRFYPDYSYELLSIKDGKPQISFDLDQRVLMRALVRFPKNYVCIPRGGSKTFCHILASYHICLYFPGITMSVLASTKQASVEIWQDKHEEIIALVPYIEDCMRNFNFSKDRGIVEFINGSKIDNLANSQLSKGKRRRRGGIEEDNLVDKEVYEDAIAPIFNVPRKTLGNIEDPEELNGQVNRYTTSGYKNSDAYQTIVEHLGDMVNLNGAFVFTSDWKIPIHFGRQKMSTITGARRGSISSFKMNYLCSWLGSSTNALININYLINSRTLKKLELECPKDKKGGLELNEYIIGVDVARKMHNKTAIAVGKIIRNDIGEIKKVQIVNIITPPQNLNYESQVIIIKRVFLRYGGHFDEAKSRVKAIVVDANTWGQGIVEELLKEQFDDENNIILKPLATINTDDVSKDPNAAKLVYCIMSQGINSAIIKNFVDYFEGKKVQLIKPFNEIKETLNEKIYNRTEVEAYCLQIDRFIDEVANLKNKPTKNPASVEIEQIIKRMDKDRYSAVAYLLYYINLFMENIVDSTDHDYVIDYS